MPDMLAALQALSASDRRFLVSDLPRNPRAILRSPIQPTEDRRRILGSVAFARIEFAIGVVDTREIKDFSIPLDQVNDGREFLGCTRLSDTGVQQIIDDALVAARAMVSPSSCCGAIGKAWTKVLVPQRQTPGQSLISDLAAAAHYMLARYHVCAAKAAPWQMKVTIDGYDANKRFLIATGDGSMKGTALTSNPPFPPDFAIKQWAYAGADEGHIDNRRCNSSSSYPFVPEVNGKEEGVLPAVE
jgi:hypothetical protein